MKQAAQDVGEAVKKALHIPDNIAPLMATLKDVSAVLLFRVGAGIINQTIKGNLSYRSFQKFKIAHINAVFALTFA